MGLSSFSGHSRVVVLTGAGISAESGISTFRDQGGTWEKFSIEEMATPEGFFSNPQRVWEFYQQRRRHVLKAKPNPGHKALRSLEKMVCSHNFELVTQNIDGLHRKAKTESLVEIHGSMYRDRCTQCSYVNERAVLYPSLPPYCPQCGSLLRPDVVWFGESLNQKDLTRTLMSLAVADFYLAVGTSGVVYPVSMFVYETKAYRIYVGMEAPANADGFDEIRLGKAGEVLPGLVKELASYVKQNT